MPSAAKPTSWRMPVPLSLRLARSVRISPSFSARFSKENLQSIGYVLFHTRKDVGQHLFHVKSVRLVKSLEKLPMAYTGMSIQHIYIVVDIDISNEMDSSSIHFSKKEYTPTTRYDAQYSAKNDLTQLSL